MSMLDRYKKPGGFIQLLTLLETCGGAKREKFLHIISEENTHWFEALKPRILTIELILDWPQEVVTELTSRTQPITLAALSKGPFTSDQITKLQHGLSHAQLSKMRELLENKHFSPNEINSSIEKFLGEVRAHIYQGVIKLDKFAPEMVVPNEIEDMLSRKGQHKNVSKVTDEAIPQEYLSPSLFQNSSSMEQSNQSTISSSEAKGPSKPGPLGNEEVVQLKKVNHQLQQELQIMRQENRILKDKLEKIRQIA